MVLRTSLSITQPAWPFPVLPVLYYSCRAVLLARSSTNPYAVSCTAHVQLFVLLLRFACTRNSHACSMQARTHRARRDCFNQGLLTMGRLLPSPADAESPHLQTVDGSYGCRILSYSTKLIQAPCCTRISRKWQNRVPDRPIVFWTHGRRLLRRSVTGI
jgi:hypothetical protein